MTPNLMKQIMVNQNLSNWDLAIIAEVSERQVRNWLTGVYAVPQMLSIILTGMEEGVINPDWLVELIEKEKREKIV